MAAQEGDAKTEWLSRADALVEELKSAIMASEGRVPPKRGARARPVAVEHDHAIATHGGGRSSAGTAAGVGQRRGWGRSRRPRSRPRAASGIVGGTSRHRYPKRTLFWRYAWRIDCSSGAPPPAVAAFLGFCVQSLDAVKGAHSTVPYRGYVENVSPQEQWDNIPVIGKLQILTFVGMLESYGEIPGDVPHYTAPGGKPGYYPPIKGNRPEILFDLYKPFDIFPEQTEEEKARGRLVEVNNGRAAMLGIMAVLSESKGLVVPPLDYIDGFPKYSGDIMVPFEGQFHVNEALGAWTEAVLAR